MTSATPSRSHEPRDIQDIGDVRQFVDRFYASVRADAVLGLIFDDIAHTDWPEHLPLMYQFWETILFTRQAYKGNPLAVHLKLEELMQQEHGIGLEKGDFDRWIELFRATIDELFSGPQAEKAKRSAERVAGHLLASLSKPEGLFAFLPPPGQSEASNSLVAG